ncbi:MAG: phosphatase PAP2 family protein [Intestinibacter bartlettii]|uniref:phosphatase PAP2 family protein n=1 Tax=Intestinibacter bartlettii TaxID=261299 RepID=UPI0026F2A697|nr:phosphatase PAP2 family protein [Intestinibacter bartlettii]MDO5010003.1 phosphatase PAP2 family protein [Intestinibacter bartlettii]
MIVKREGEASMDILLFFQSIRNDILTAIFTLFTICTEQVAVVLIAAIMYWCIDKKCGQRILFAVTGSITINSALKNLFKAPRPIGSNNLESLRTETATGYSFPSGHTQTATTVWTAIIEYFRKWWVTLLGIIMIIGAGISRLYLGVHWPQDVAAGWIIGILVSIILVKLFDYVDENKSYYILLLTLILFAIVVYFFIGEELVKSFALYTGFVLGYIVEDKFINFSTEESKKRANIFTNNKSKPKLSVKILRFVVGIITLGIIYAAAKSLVILLLPNASEEVLLIADYIRYTIVVFWGIAGAPFLFERFGLN